MCSSDGVPSLLLRWWCVFLLFCQICNTGGVLCHTVFTGGVSSLQFYQMCNTGGVSFLLFCQMCNTGGVSYLLFCQMCNTGGVSFLLFLSDV